jgi:hypothetical protein
MGLVKNIRNQKTNFHIIKSFPVGYSTVAVLPPVALDGRSCTGSSTNSWFLQLPFPLYLSLIDIIKLRFSHGNRSTLSRAHHATFHLQPGVISRTMLAWISGLYVVAKKFVGIKTILCDIWFVWLGCKDSQLATLIRTYRPNSPSSCLRIHPPSSNKDYKGHVAILVESPRSRTVTRTSKKFQRRKR